MKEMEGHQGNVSPLATKIVRVVVTIAVILVLAAVVAKKFL